MCFSCWLVETTRVAGMENNSQVSDKEDDKKIGQQSTDYVFGGKFSNTFDDWPLFSVCVCVCVLCASPRVVLIFECYCCIGVGHYVTQLASNRWLFLTSLGLMQFLFLHYLLFSFITVISRFFSWLHAAFFQRSGYNCVRISFIPIFYFYFFC